MINVPDVCLPLLKEHRTHYKTDLASGYAQEIAHTFETIKALLPQVDSPKVLDIGCGMCGIDVLINQHYQSAASFYLLDKQGKSPEINSGFHKTAESFSHYHDFGAALALLAANGMGDSQDGKLFKPVDISTDKFPQRKFAIVISLLSWGFHYPIATYGPKVLKGGVIIADVRKGTDGEQALAEYGELTVVHEAQKYRRVVVQC